MRHADRKKHQEGPVKVDPPSEDVLLAIAKQACAHFQCPQATYEMAAYLAVVSRMQANALNVLARLDKPTTNE